ncbi:MAG: VOC family protein [Psychrosphaera sp.]|nr:VOC family protein [Psychrosphaera sp.]
MNELQLDTQSQKSVCDHLGRIDHLAIAVPDLEEALSYYLDVLGFTLESRLETNGNYTGMVSAVVRAAKFSIVLLQGTTPSSQVSRFVTEHGGGVQHVAFEVENLENTRKVLEARGQTFITDIIEGPGLKQFFTARDKASGMMFEYIQRVDNDGFAKESVAKLFKQMEEADAI